MDPVTLRRMNDEVSGLLVTRLGAKGASLEARIASRARALPRKVRRAARVLVSAEGQIGAPKIARQIDARAVGAAHAICVGYLRPLGFGARLWGGTLQVVATVFFGIVLMVAALLILRRITG